MMPLAIELCWFFEIFLRTIFTKSGRGMTARDTIKSNFPFSSSPRSCAVSTFSSPIAFIISRATFTFLPVPSMRRNLHSGKRMAKGTPGKPPPVPKSRIDVCGLKRITRAIAIECSTWCSYKLSISLREITFILSFHSLYKASRFWNCSLCFWESWGKYLSIICI